MNTPETLDCGHAMSTAHIYNGRPAWQFVLDFDNKRRICHACADARVLDCGHTPSEHSHFTTGYGTRGDGSRHCYACCAQRERAEMLETGRAVLYLTRDADGYKVGNWPDSLTFRAHRVKHAPRARGFDADRVDVWFTDVAGAEWHGVNRGGDQILRCRRLKPGRTR